MGVGMALTPCGPLGIVLFSAAASGYAGNGFLLGAGFGLGAIVVPSLVYGFGVAYFGGRLREQLGPWRPRIEALCSGLLILTGMSQLIRAF
jgi:cytochrome c biogenesis protein CcdA